jgi:aminoglycoside phosphotransferase (APT) family kinase protein
MTDDQLARALQAMGLSSTLPGHLRAGSASGSGVYRIDDPTMDAVVKVTTDVSWRRQARRELRWYREFGGRLPVRMPRLFAWADTDAVTAMLLSAHRPAPAAPSWTEPHWLRLAADLGALHAAAPPPTTIGERWLSDGQPLRSNEVASTYWAGTTAAEVAAALADAGPALARDLERTPVCLVHGDCHVGNLLQDEDGSLVWADWQEVGVGHGESDLAFVWLRAEIDAGSVPREAMLRRYVATRGVDLEVSRRAVLAAELALVMFAWPEYAGWNDQEARDRMTRRLTVLAAAWGRPNQCRRADISLPDAGTVSVRRRATDENPQPQREVP